MYWFCIHDIATRQKSELRNGKALPQDRISGTKIRSANGWIQGSERKPRRRGIPSETQEAKWGSRECPCSRQCQNSIPLSSNRISMARPLAVAAVLSRELGFGRTKVRRARLEFRPPSLPANSGTLRL